MQDMKMGSGKGKSSIVTPAPQNLSMKGRGGSKRKMLKKRSMRSKRY